MKKTKVQEKNITNFINNGDKKSVLSITELSQAQLRYLLKDCRIDGLPIATMADPERAIQTMIEGKIESLLHISDLINHYNKDDAKIKDAALPVLGKCLKPKYCKTIDPFNLREIQEWEAFLDTVPDEQKYNTLTWNDFRKKRKKSLNGYNLSQSLEVFAPNTLRIFPLAALFDYTELGIFKIIQDDCNDMVDFLKHVKKLSPIFLIILFSRIDEIESRFNYLSGYFKVEYQRKEILHEHFSNLGGLGGGKEKTNQPILLAITQYLQAHPKVVDKSNTQILNSFKRHVREDNPIIVNFNGCEWDVYCAYNNIWSEPDTSNKLKHKGKSIAYSTFTNSYISKAKKII